MKRLKFLLITIIIIALTITTIGCQNGNNDKSSTDNISSNKNTIVRLAGGDYGEPSPYQHYPRGSGIYKMRLIFDSLLEKDENGMIPWLAKDWTIENDGKTYIFNIQDNVKWQDGEDMTIEDIKFSFEYFMEYPPVSNSLLIDGEPFIDSIELLDESSIKINVKEANATILECLGETRIIPKHIWGNIDDPKNFTGQQAMMGCGPYICEEYNKELGSYKFIAFEDYWGLTQAVDEIHFIPVSDKTLAFEQGDIDLASIPPDVLKRYENNNKYAIIQQPAFWGYRLIFNLEEVSEFNDKNNRQAIANAVDIDNIIEKVARGAAVPASTAYLPIDHLWYNDNVENYNYNIEKAKNLIGNSNFSFTLLCGNNTTEARIAELIKLSLDKIGISVTIDSVDSKTRDSAVKDKNYQAVIYGHGGWGEDADSLRKIYASNLDADSVPTSTSIPGFEDSRVEDLANSQLYELDAEKRKQIVFELQEIISEELPMLPLYNTTGYQVYRPAVFDGWMNMYDHHYITHSKLSYLNRK